MWHWPCLHDSIGFRPEPAAGAGVTAGCLADIRVETVTGLPQSAPTERPAAQEGDDGK